MAAKKKTTKKAPAKKEAPKKRIKPVVEEVVEEPEETKEEETEEVEEEVVEETVEEETPEVEEEVIEEEVVEDDGEDMEAVSGKTSIEPDFAAGTETNEESPSEELEEEVVEETVEEEVSKDTEPTESAPVKEKPESASDTGDSANKMSVKTILLITVISALVAAFVSGGVYVYLTGVNSRGASDTEETTDVAEKDHDSMETEATPTPEPEEDVDVSDYSVQVLNGSGQIGAAGEGSDVVEGAGFVVDDTGNADNYDFEETVVRAKSDIPSSVVDDLVKALEEEYEVEVGDELDSDSEYDIIVTVGSK